MYRPVPKHISMQVHIMNFTFWTEGQHTHHLIGSRQTCQAGCQPLPQEWCTGCMNGGWTFFHHDDGCKLDRHSQNSFIRSFVPDYRLQSRDPEPWPIFQFQNLGLANLHSQHLGIGIFGVIHSYEQLN